MFKKFTRIITYFYTRYVEDNLANRAAALAYTTLLSIVPFFVVIFSILSVFPFFKGTDQAIQRFILDNFVAASANIIAEHLKLFESQITALSWTNIAALVFVSLLMIYNMVRAFNSIWHVQLRRHFALSFLIYLVILFLAPLLFGVLLAMSSYFASLPLISSAAASYVKQPLIIILPYFSSFIVFTFFNWALPSCKVKLSYAVIAGLVTMIFFELAKYVFVLYIKFFPTYRIIYGALATIPVFLIWLYVSWTVILLGALICNVMSEGFK